MLRRRVGESVVIDGDITVTVSEIRSGRVSLAFTAPPEVEILREELIEEEPDASD